MTTKTLIGNSSGDNIYYVGEVNGLPQVTVGTNPTVVSLHSYIAMSQSVVSIDVEALTQAMSGVKPFKYVM